MPDENAPPGFICRLTACYNAGMLKSGKIDEFIQEVMKMVPEDMHRARADLEHSVKAAIHAAFARMDLVTREEYDVQAELLRRTRALLQELEARQDQLEQELKQQKTE